MRCASPNPRVSRPSLWPPLDLRPLKVVRATQAACQKSPSSPGLPPTPALWSDLRGGHGGRPAASPAAAGSLPVWHARSHPGGWRHLPTYLRRARGRKRGPAHGAHVLARPEPLYYSLTQIASSSSHAGPARAIPAAAAHRGLRSPLGLPRLQLRRVQMPPPLPAAPRLRVPGATSAKACAPRGKEGERRPGRNACWEL